jgi:hypothetical protein
VHSVLKLPEFELQQCLFGEHLLRAEPQKPVAIVESEKTAIISSVYLPDFIWLAVGSLNNLTAERCKQLAGRKVILYPDLKALDKWKAKAAELSKITKFVVSDLLERKATEADKQKGFDLADYLIRFPVPIKKSTSEQSEAEKTKNIQYRFKEALENEVLETGIGNPDNWFEVFTKEGLLARDAIISVYQLSKKLGFEIEAEPATDSEIELNEYGYPASWDIQIPVQAGKVHPLPVKSELSRLEQLQAKALHDFNKYPLFKNKTDAGLKYFSCWANDMEDFIREAGSTPYQFLKRIEETFKTNT